MSAVTQYKALTHINLPFLGDDDEGRFTPGDMIPRELFERSAENAVGAIHDRSAQDPNASPILTADETIEELMTWGSLSDDPDAPLHPDSIIPEVGAVTITSIIMSAQALVDQLEADGKDVPAELRALAQSDNHVATTEAAKGVDHNV